jgi:hypothetical protein
LHRGNRLRSPLQAFEKADVSFMKNSLQPF